MKRLVYFSFAMLLGVAVLANPGSSSQATVKRIVLTGTVYDRNHAVIVSSQITAQNAEGKNFWAVTNNEGVSKFEIPLDEYRIEANAPGFCPRRIALARMLKTSMPKPLDFVLEMEQSDRPCALKTMIKKAPPRDKELPRHIAE
jgi:hypothetical protein